jgi:glycosyltransferase involved in cell wall biosynthesis
MCAMPYALGMAPSQRFRWEQWGRLLGQFGVDVTFVPFSTKALHAARTAKQQVRAARLAVGRFPSWARELTHAREADVVVVQRNAAVAGPPFAELAFTKMGVPMVYDFDDAIYLPPETGDTALRRVLRCDWRVGVVAKRATLVTVGNPTLAEYAQRFTSRVEIVPTTIHIAAYPLKSESSDGPPVIGWSGSRTTAKYLEWILPVLRDLYRQERFRLLVMGAKVDLSGLDGECIPWSEETEIAGLHRMDIGLMPSPDTVWARGKCALKALQYLAIGIPAVASDVGVNAQAVPDGECGFVVRTPEEWRARLLDLLKDPARCRRLGHAGREHVIRNYSAEAWTPRIAETLHMLAHGQATSSASAPQRLRV